MYLFIYFLGYNTFTRVIHDKFIKSGAKVTVSHNVEDVMNRIKEKLIDSQKEMLSKICFGAVLNFSKFTPSPRILINLMCRIVNVRGSNSDEMYFNM